MPEQNTPVNLDVAGYDEITAAISALLNQYPELQQRKIEFSTLDKDGGIAFFPMSGGVIEQQMTDITGFVHQSCVYPFSVVYRTAPLTGGRRTAVKEWLDRLGCWLEKQNVTIGQTAVKLEEYPALTGGRRFTAFSRTTPAYLSEIEANAAEDWVINIAAHYINEFYR